MSSGGADLGKIWTSASARARLASQVPIYKKISTAYLQIVTVEGAVVLLRQSRGYTMFI